MFLQLLLVGIVLGGGSHQFKKLLLKRGIRINGVSEVLLPDNYILLFNLLPIEEQQKNMLNEADEHIKQLIIQIKDKKLATVKLEISKYFKTQLVYPVYICGRKTKHFYTTDNCNSCKYCTEICPMDIISMDKGKPQWTKDRCIQCLACLHSCPQKAIQHKRRTEKRGRYRNPNVIL